MKTTAMRNVPRAQAMSYLLAFQFNFVIGVFQIIWNMLSPNSIVLYDMIGSISSSSSKFWVDLINLIDMTT